MPLFSYPIALSRGVSNFVSRACTSSSEPRTLTWVPQFKLRRADFYAAARSTARLAQLVTGHQCPVKIRTVPLRMSQRFAGTMREGFQSGNVAPELVSEYLRRVSPECSRVCSLSAAVALR